MAYKRDGETVTLTMTAAQWQHLLLTMGLALGTALKGEQLEFFYSMVRLVNSLNEGNTHFRPYALPPEEVTQ